MKRKTITGLIGITMGITFALPIHADDTSMTIEYQKATTYTLHIPTGVTLSSDSNVKSDTIGVSKVNTAPNEKVQVAVKSGIDEHGNVVLTRKDDSATTAISTVTDKDGKIVKDHTVVAEFEGTLNTPITEGTGILNFSAITASEGTIVKAGSYHGTLVFEASVVAKE